MDRFKAVTSYDGNDFFGFQIQAQGRTVQGEIEKALHQIAKVPIRIVGAGRTDTGVHAVGQVIAFNLHWNHSTQALQRALNVYLPVDIVISHLEKVQAIFHPRFDAISRQYRYTIINQTVRSALAWRYTTHIPHKLNVESMKQATSYLLGTHDFASFGKPPQGDNTVRTVIQTEWRTNGDIITFDITANAFLYRMVRSIVGTLLQVGLNKIDVESVNTILMATNRAMAKQTARASGLCLVKVNY